MVDNFIKLTQIRCPRSDMYIFSLIIQVQHQMLTQKMGLAALQCSPLSSASLSHLIHIIVIFCIVIVLYML